MKLDSATVSLVQAEGISSMTVHGNAIVSCEVVKAQNVCNPAWMIPYWFWVVAQVPLLRYGNSSGVAVQCEGKLGVMNVMQELMRGDDVDGGAAVGQDPCTWDVGVALSKGSLKLRTTVQHYVGGFGCTSIVMVCATFRLVGGY